MRSLIVLLTAIAVNSATVPAIAADSAALAKWFPPVMCPAFKESSENPPTAKFPSEDFAGMDKVFKLLAPDSTRDTKRYAYDPVHHIAYFNDDHSATWGTVTLREISAPPSVKIPFADLHTAHLLKSGIHIGTSARVIVQLLGKAKFKTGCGLTRYEYYVNPMIPNDLTIITNSERVIEITESYGD